MLFRSSLVAALIVLSAPVGAAEYTVDAIVDQYVFYNGNVGLFPDPASAAQDLRDKYSKGYELSPQLNLRVRDPRWQIGLSTRLDFTRHSDQLFDSDDQVVGLTYSYGGERNRWDLASNISRLSTRSAVAELGSVLAATRYESLSANPRWTRVLNEKNSIALGANWSRVEYQTTRFTDYDYYGVDLTWLRQLNEKNLLSVAVYQSIFDSGEESFNRESETIGLNLSLDRTINESFTTSVSLGTRKVDTITTAQRPCSIFEILFGVCPPTGFITSVGDSSSTGVNATAGLDYQGELYSVSANLSRSLVPNGAFGTLLETDNVGLAYTRRLAERLYFDFSLSFIQEELLGPSDFSRDRFRIEPRVRWQFAERWNLSSSVAHITRDSFQFGRGNDAEGTTISVRVRYTHPRKSWSR
ncbi:MAG: hypothetical protein KJO35_10795 [Gammaproteobacteria bacterium]|nr:hypothetical protein [Gammaproteobacteria bacterium]